MKVKSTSRPVTSETDSTVHQDSVVKLTRGLKQVSSVLASWSPQCGIMGLGIGLLALLGRTYPGRRNTSKNGAMPSIATNFPGLHNLRTNTSISNHDVGRHKYIFGRPENEVRKSVDPYTLAAQRLNYDMVDPNLILNAQEFIPLQSDKWSCSFNSGSRFAMMHNREIENYLEFLFSGPLSLNIPLVKIGPDPGTLARYLAQQRVLSGCVITSIHGSDNGRVFEEIQRQLKGGRPAIILTARGQDSFHYENIVARKKDGSAYVIMNTDGRLGIIDPEVLKHIMDASPYFLSEIGSVNSFNAVVAAGECKQPYSLALYFNSQYYFDNYPDVAHGMQERTRRGQALWLYRHFTNHGIDEGKSASPNFCAKSYLNNYTDLKKAFGPLGYRMASHYYFHFGRHRGHDARPHNLSQTTKKFHVVKPGESLPKISKKNGASLALLKEENSNIKNFNLIYPGQKIILPRAGFGAYEIKTNDNLTKISRRLGVTIAYMLTINPQIKDKNLIYAGANLNVP